MITGVPASSRNCFGRSLAIRVPAPAAAIIAMFMKRDRNSYEAVSALRNGLAVRDTHRRRSVTRITHLAPRSAIRAMNIAVSAVFRFFPETAEDHLTGSGLQHAGDCDIGVLADQPARIINHHHRSIIEIGHALIVFLAFLQDENPHRLAWEYDRLERICQLINIEYADPAQLGDFVQVEIVGDDHRVELFAELDQLQINFAHGRKVSFYDLNVERTVVL